MITRKKYLNSNSMFFKIEKVFLNQDNTNLTYNYSYSKELNKYFSKQDIFYVNYKEDISTVPDYFLNIPLMSNLTPISWFVGFDIYLETLDEDYYNSLKKLKKVFKSKYPEIEQNKSEIFVKKIIKREKDNIIDNIKTALLFTGGVDAYFSLLCNYEENPSLIKIIKEGNQKIQKDTFELNFSLNSSEKIINENKKIICISNFDLFYTDKIKYFHRGFGWWSHIQHGMGLTGLVAPLAYKYNYNKLLIASSYTSDIKIDWGSAPEIDNEIAWGGLNVYHHGYDYKRVDKILGIANEVEKLDTSINLRVCFSTDNKGVNCSNCEKCLRTILALKVFGYDPNNYGFDTEEDLYIKVSEFLKSGFSSEGVRYFWNEIYRKYYSKIQSDNYQKLHSDNEKAKIKLIMELIEKELNVPVKSKSYIKQALLRKFPFLKGKIKALKSLLN